MAALITLHGMGQTELDYAAELFAGVRSRLGTQAARVRFEPVYYQRKLQENQDEVWRRMSSETRLGWQSLRKFVLFSLSDAVDIETGKDEPKSSYLAAQTNIARTMLSARGDAAVQPLVVIAQSLGGHVFSSYLYDAQRARRAAAGQARPPPAGIWRNGSASIEQALGQAIDDATMEYLRGSSLLALLTTGCPIALYVAACLRMQAIAIEPPAPGFEWHNYFDPQDVLGWPLQPLEGGYRQLVRDHSVNVGNLLTSWNPLSHRGYWSDGGVQDEVVKQIVRALTPDEPPTNAAARAA